MRIIKQFAPFGPGNMTPVFMSENLKDSGYAKVVGQEGKHLKCKLFDKKNGSKRSAIDAIGFNLGKYLPTISDHTISAVFTLDENEWQGNITLQMKLRDIKEPDSYQI
jgi:single-stranded-DNA-specific exonuclease